MELFKKPYEISLWDDVLIFEYESGEPSENKVVEGQGAVKRQYYKERKNCIIGSNTMTSPIRVINPKMVSNINGTNVFTFELPSHYYDEESGEFLQNPFVSLLFNERKIKVREGALYVEKWDDKNEKYVSEVNKDVKWYDLIIKEVQENSEKKIFTYTAKDQYINELSKTGYELTFDDKLENSTGTVKELGGAILEGSDWQVEGDIVFYEGISDPLYKFKVYGTFTLDGILSDEKVSFEKLAKDNSIELFIFYNDVVNRKNPAQVVYMNGREPQMDSDNNITNGNNYYLSNINYAVLLDEIEKEIGGSIELNGVQNNNNQPARLMNNVAQIDEEVGEDSTPNPIVEPASISEYRAKRLVESKKTIYDPLLDRFVEVYERVGDKEKKTYHAYSVTDYTTTEMVQSCVVNPNGLNGNTGWETYEFSGNLNEARKIETPAPEVVAVNDKILSYFVLNSADNRLVNTGLYQNSHLFPKGLPFDSKYVFSAIVGKLVGNKILWANPPGRNDNKTLTEYLHVAVAEMKRDGTYNDEAKTDKYTTNNSIMRSWDKDNAKFWFDDDNGNTRINIIMTVTSGVAPEDWGAGDVPMSHEQLKNIMEKISLIIRTKNPEVVNAITNVQFFPYVPYTPAEEEGETEPFIRPGDVPKATITQKYYFYDTTLNSSVTNPEDLKYIEYNGFPQGYKIPDDFNSYEKKRTLRASKSNRFNLLSQLCELFECWVKFRVERDLETGAIHLDENGYPKKFISFHDYSNIEINNFAGFKYGINLKSISRKLQSDSIASKLIVEDNSNEFGKDGYCSIMRASANPTGENFLYDFGYYIQKRMLNHNLVTQDLYFNNINHYLGYYPKLKAWNIERDELIEHLSGLKTAQDLGNSSVQTYTLALKNTKDKKENIVTVIKTTTDSGWDGNIWGNGPVGWENDPDVIANLEAARKLETAGQEYEKALVAANANLNDVNLKIKEAEEALARIAEQKLSLNKNFYKKYSRFIQEGTWISEDYTDDNLYYLDAQNTLSASRSPKVDYTINVLELSQVEGYENFQFALGEKTYVEDVEFFGWRLDGSGRPYQEEVIITELTSHFDSPEQNQIKVQNYKTQFEDLFQRLESTSQQLEYKSGAYNRASGIVEAGGTINATTLQNSFNNNAFTLQNAKDQTVIWDEQGITTTSPSDPANIVKIVNGGIFLTSDGGATWRTGITGKGMSADYIIGGQIDSEVVRIMNGSFPSFRWDSSGINAYKMTTTGTDSGTFIRLDQYGLYGIKGQERFDPLEKDSEGNIDPLARIKKYANFSLTWDGFQIKSTQRDGYISITEDNDFQVFNNNKCVLKIGQLSEGEENESGELIDPRFGLRMMDNHGNITLDQDNQGKLWLRHYISMGPIDYIRERALTEIGYLPETIEVDEEREDGSVIKKIYHEVFNANDKFVVYENGRMEAQEGNFSGNISAQTGEIGGFKIENGILYSTENQEASSKENAKIVLDGLTGSLVAKKGSIGGFRISGTMLCSTEGSSAGEEKIRLDGANGTGHFQGEIVAQSGIIGGFLISNNYLEARTGTLVLDGWQGKIQASKGLIGGFQISNNYFESQNYNSLRKGIRLDGQNAIIRLGSEQEQEIQLLGLEGKIIVKSKAGSASSVFDSITIDAKTGSMYSYQYGSGLTAGWYIDSNEAIFNNITARGSIKASVFEYGEVQAVGGILLVRPSTRILSQLLTESQDYFIFKVESAVGFKANDLCLITPAPGKQVYFIISEIKDEQDHKILECSLQSDYSNIGESNFSGMPIVNLGQPGDIGIGINASTIGGIIEPQSISVFELGKNTQLNTHLILGKIPSEAIYGDMAGSYGLFADNVHLSGSLVTSNKFGYSSGIRTTPREKDKKIISIHFKENNGEILLWAGAIDETAGSIQNANFYVNEKGYLHANGAHFNGSVLSDAIITASEIKTAIITGTGKDPALLIKDAYTGIVFSGEKIIRKGSETLFKIIGKIKTYSVDESTSPESIKSYIDELSSRGFIISGSISKNKLEEIDSFDSSVKETLLEGGIQYWETKYQNKTFFQVAKDNFMIDTSSIELKGEIYTSGSLNLGEYVNGFESQLILSTDGIKKNGNNLLFDENSIVVEIANNAAMLVDPTNLMINKKLTLSQGISYQDDAAYVPVKNSNNEVVGYNLYVY